VRKFGWLIALLLVLLLVGLLFPVPRPHISVPAEAVFHLGPIPITNTMLASWVTVLVIIGLFYAGTSRMKLVPTGLQNAIEWAIETLLNFAETTAGKENGRRFFPVIATIFFFVIFNAWLGLIPGFNTIGFGEAGEQMGLLSSVKAPLLRAANTDINLPLALAVMSFIFVEYWGVSSLGFFRYGSKFIRVRELLRGKIFIGFIDLFVGALEALSELVRLISFTFRLFGNMFAGEVLLLVIVSLVPWVAVLMFYALEILVGFVQALVFAGLTLVFAMVAVAEHGNNHQ